MEKQSSQQAETKSLEGRLLSIASIFRVPILLGILGLSILIVSFILLTRQRLDTGITFMENSASASAITASTIVVDIEGEVLRPGVYVVENGARIDDLLIKAGGLSADADRDWMAKSLNKAMKLTDGAKIYIPEVGERKETAQTEEVAQTLGVSTNQININSASIQKLDTLPGVGEATAKKIVGGRPYQTVDELKSKKVVGNSVFEKIKELVTVF